MTRLMALTVVVVAWSLFSSIPIAKAVIAEAAPATSPGAGQSLQIEITGIEGIVQYRTGDDQKWQRAEVGMRLNENAELRTATRSAVQFLIPPDQTITLDRVGVI